MDPLRDTGRGSWGNRLRGLVYLGPVMILAPFLTRFLYLRGAAYSDLTISHLPNLLFLGESIRAGQIPLWSPAILSGFPFFADPLAGMWYPPGWPAAMWPQAWVFNLLALLHLLFGMVGMQRYLRELRLGAGAQALGALAFGLLPKLLAHYAAGHVTLLYALVWTPWLLIAEHQRGRRLRPGVVLAAIFLADPRWAAYAGALWLFYRAAHSHLSGEARRGKAPSRKHLFRGIFFEVLLAILLAGPLLVPLIEFSSRSSRALITPAETLAFSLPPARLVGLLLPLVGGQVEWVLFTGGMVLVGAAASVALPDVRRKVRFWAVLAVFSLFFALGDHVPVLRLWAYLPGANLLRVPPRALFLFGFSLVVIMAHGVEAFSASTVLALRDRRLLLRLSAGFAGISLALISAGFILQGDLREAGIYAGISTLLAAASLGGRVSGRLPVLWFMSICSVLIFADSAVFSYISFKSQIPDKVFSQGQEAADWLAGQPGLFRVYSPSYSIPQHTAARAGLALADGVDPLQLESYAAFMEKAAGVPREGYSVTVPAMAGDPASANSGNIPDPILLGLLNVRFVTVEYDLDVPGLELRQQFGETRIYQNVFDQGRTWLIGKSGEVPEVVQWTPNRIEIRCVCGPGTIVLSEMDYPGWQVTGGRLTKTSKGNLRAIEIAGAEEQIELVFRPLSLYVGLIFFGVAAAFLLLQPKAGSDVY